MHRIALLLAFALAPLIAPSAQRDVAASEQRTRDSVTRVSFEVRANAPGTAEGARRGSAADIPLGVLRSLRAEPSLVSLNVESGHGSSHALTARFEFPTLEAFERWYASEQGTALLAELQTASGSALVQSALRVDRPLVRRGEP